MVVKDTTERITPETVGIEKEANSKSAKSGGKSTKSAESKSESKRVETVEKAVKSKPKKAEEVETEKVIVRDPKNFGWLTNDGLVDVRYVGKQLAARKNALEVLLNSKRITTSIPLRFYETNAKKTYYQSVTFNGLRLNYPKNTMVEMPQVIYKAHIQPAYNIKQNPHAVSPAADDMGNKLSDIG